MVAILRADWDELPKPGNMSKVVEMEDVWSLQEPANSLLGLAAQCAGGEVGEQAGRKEGC